VRRLVVADSHVGQRRDDAARMCRMVERAVGQGIGELLYLGDAFHYLIGLPKFWTGSVRTVLECWEQARGRGVRVGLIEGNRDFFLDEPDLEPYLDWWGRSTEFVAGARRVRVVHGDRVNPEDRQYLFWARVSKSGIARRWAHLLPRAVAVRIVRSMEARLARTNQRFRYRIPAAALEADAKRAWREGVDVVLWGHFHAGWRLEHDGRHGLVVPAWLDTDTALLVEEDGGMRQVDERLRPVPGGWSLAPAGLP
jgi:UDP-2,3-diacylglucosamine pyrophosphatase LpxH